MVKGNTIHTITQIDSKTVIKPKRSFGDKFKTFWVLNWRILVLLLLLIGSIAFIIIANAQVDDNFTNTFN